MRPVYENLAASIRSRRQQDRLVPPGSGHMLDVYLIDLRVLFQPELQLGPVKCLWLGCWPPSVNAGIKVVQLVELSRDKTGTAEPAPDQPE